MKNIIDIQKFQEFDNLEFIAKQVVEGFITGLHRSPFHGFSVEFAEHRLYNQGESTKHIDWKLFARTEKLFVKRYEEETNLRSHLIVDTSSSMNFPFDAGVLNKLSFSAYSAAALIYLLRKQRDAVGLTLFSDKIELHTDAKLSVIHSKLLYSELSKLLQEKSVKEKKQTKTSTILHQIAESIHQRSLVILFSDMFENENFEEIFPALQHLRYNKHEVILFHVFDKKRELEFDFKNRPYKFIDLETGDEVKFNPNDVRGEYISNINKHFNEIKLRCGQYKIDLINADINQDFKEVLLPYLIKRSKLY
ncbi:MAG: DUF58 domain-containing protein [Bacteroidetes bacterium]|nr:DUF58 domain-containing protein [Bacteroidota bacterium]MBT6686047.1 DUF58 domain-containing protein [Bacteroidota bacterium]MBT7142733.1 DUF58 domain-containing protein [Bacteroidota bacterium]MBT7491326.1 DUF58 domain-containing protein [Bacteroidota bacterium]